MVDARTEVTTQLLADDGFIVSVADDTGDEHEETYKQREFEKRFFSEATNQVFCKTFLENALRDPVSREIGKSIVFAVSQRHAARLTQTFNEMADAHVPREVPLRLRRSGHLTRYRMLSKFTIYFAHNQSHGFGAISVPFVSHQ